MVVKARKKGVSSKEGKKVVNKVSKKSSEKKFSFFEGGLIELEAILLVLFVLKIWTGAREFLFSLSYWYYLGAWVIVFSYLMYKVFGKE